MANKNGIMLYKKIVCFLLFFLLTVNVPSFSISPSIEQNNRVEQSGNTLHIYPSRSGYIGAICGTVALSAAALALFIYAKVKRNKLKNNTDEKSYQDYKNHETCYWIGGAFGVLGLALLGVTFNEKHLCKFSLATLDEDGISYDGKKISWENLWDVQNYVEHRFVPGYKRCTGYKNGKRIDLDVPTTHCVTEEKVKLIQRRDRLDFSCDWQDRDMKISTKRFPISRRELIGLISEYKARFG